jgi:hypothetical protein
MLIGVNEGYDNRKVTARFNKMSRTHFVSAQEPGHGMKDHRSSDILRASTSEFQV